MVECHLGDMFDCDIFPCTTCVKPKDDVTYNCRDAAEDQLQDIKTELEWHAEAEQDYADNMPENMLYSEKHERAEELASEIEDIGEELDEIITRVTQVIGGEG